MAFSINLDLFPSLTWIFKSHIGFGIEADVDCFMSARAESSYVLWLYNQTSRIKTIKQPTTHGC